MATKYKTCEICGHTHPLGHPCLTCNKKGIKGMTVEPKDIADYVKVLRLHKNDIIVFKNIDIRDEEMYHFITHLSEIPLIKQKKIECIFLPKDGEIFVMRDR